MTNKRLAALVASGVLVLGGGVGVAGALEGSSRPAAPKAEDSQRARVDDSTTTTSTTDTTVDRAGVAGNEAEHPVPEPGGDNHGGDVSSVARSTNRGPGHGQAVSDTAQDNRGRDHAEDDNGTEVDDTNEAEDANDDHGDHGPNHDANDDHGGDRASGGSGRGGHDDGPNHD
ncbi:MAG TPA: hypothetical protein VGO92_03185 [Acidimicrobiales bacterium]|jgi:hypothetical protein|nr:hypothetical protein [Acidimicrobiales bacterium]